MSRSANTVVVLSLVILILASCVEASNSYPLVKLDDDNNNQTVEIQVGQKADLVLDENPTTGYRWEIVTMDKAVLKQAEEPEFKPDSEAIGAGGKKTFHFRAVASGRTNLKLIYHRSWETSVPPIKTFEVTIIVK